MSDDYFLDGAAVDSLSDDAVATVVAEEAPKKEKAATSAGRKAAPRAAVSQPSKSGMGPLYFDIETTPDYDRLATFGLEPVPPVPEEADESKCPNIAETVKGTADQIKAALRGVVAPSAWLDKLAEAERAGKDRTGVHDEIAKARKVRLDAIAAHDERRKLLSTTPEFCSIAAFSWYVGGDTTDNFRALVRDNSLKTIKSPDDSKVKVGFASEQQILEVFWKLAEQFSPVCGFNIAYFDLPVILVRSAILGVEPAKVFDMRPWGNDVVDIYLGRFGPKGNTDSKKPGKLKLLAPLYGIEVPAGDVEGSQVESLMQTDPVKVGTYCISDVKITVKLHQALAGYFWR
jgi:hypothetical protein